MATEEEGFMEATEPYSEVAQLGSVGLGSAAW